MIGYYPQAVQSIQEFQAIVNSEYPEIELVSECDERILSDAYLLTMGEDRISEWEQLLGIRPLVGSSVSDRRETVVARIRAQSKLNTETINAIVNAFTGGTAESKVENSSLYVRITMPPGNKQFQFDNVWQEIKRKIPAHLGLNVERGYNTWQDIKDDNVSWKEVIACYETWWDVLYNNKTNPNELDKTTFDRFYLG